MSQAQFSEFMQDQMNAIEQSGQDPETWIAENAEAFRASWEKAHV